MLDSARKPTELENIFANDIATAYKKFIQLHYKKILLKNGQRT